MLIATLREFWTHRNDIKFRNAKPSPLQLMLKSKGREKQDDLSRGAKGENSRLGSSKGPKQMQLIGKECLETIYVESKKCGSGRWRWRITAEGVEMAISTVENNGMTKLQLEMICCVAVGLAEWILPYSNHC